CFNERYIHSSPSFLLKSIHVVHFWCFGIETTKLSPVDALILDSMRFQFGMDFGLEYCYGRKKKWNHICLLVADEITSLVGGAMGIVPKGV
ncbi:MAG TPA: hypothetical protein PLU50_10515, partial [Pseudobdellovibrionaceae bacterium]|nr:hypothetical protein [Pseudobdellovibrionaceae bacterium]